MNFSPQFFILYFKKYGLLHNVAAVCVCFLFQLERLKVGEATRVFFIFIGNCKNGLLKLVIAKLLKRHRGCDRWKDGDVCRETQELTSYICQRYSF